jgi:hypothetical protein
MESLSNILEEINQKLCKKGSKVRLTVEEVKTEEI